jgi:predicted small lipoprotein YifL
VLRTVMGTVNKGRMQGRLRLWLAALVALGTLGLTGCGVRGSLETPPREKAETGDAVPGTPGQPVPHKPSMLDPLIR